MERKNGKEGNGRNQGRGVYCSKPFEKLPMQFKSKEFFLNCVRGIPQVCARRPPPPTFSPHLSHRRRLLRELIILCAGLPNIMILGSDLNIFSKSFSGLPCPAATRTTREQELVIVIIINNHYFYAICTPCLAKIITYLFIYLFNMYSTQYISSFPTSL